MVRSFLHCGVLSFAEGIIFLDIRFFHSQQHILDPERDRIIKKTMISPGEMVDINNRT